MGGEVALCAERDEPLQFLGAGLLAVAPALVGFQLRPFLFCVHAAALADEPDAPINEIPQSIPVCIVDAVADVGEPARARNQVDEQLVPPEAAVLALQFPYVLQLRPPSYQVLLGVRREPAPCERVPLSTQSLGFLLLGERDRQVGLFGLYYFHVSTLRM